MSTDAGDIHAFRRTRRLAKLISLCGRHAGVAVVLAVAAGSGQWLSTWVGMMWVPPALVLCGLLALPNRFWPACLAGALAGTMAAQAALPGGDGLAALVGEYALLMPAAWLLRRFRTDAPFESFGDIFRLIVIAGIALPAVGATWMVVAETGHAPSLERWIRTSLAHALGFLLFVPTFASLFLTAFRPLRTKPLAVIDFAWATVLLVAIWAYWQLLGNMESTQHLLVVVPIPIFIWSLLVFGTSGALITLLAVSLLAMRLSALGDGPFALASPSDTILGMQLWIMTTATALLVLIGLAEQRLSTRRNLQDAYAQLGQVTGKMLVVQEQERSRIARDLHDDINQSLAAISIQLSTLKPKVAEAVRVELDEIQQQLQAATSDIRRISHALHPTVLRFTGLTSSLPVLCETNSSPELQFKCVISGIPRLPDRDELNIFRITQEAIRNVQKHSHATTAQVSLVAAGDLVALRIEDDGVGFRRAPHSIGPGLGMVSMEERARQLGGHLDVGPRLDDGTRVEVIFPLRATDAATGTVAGRTITPN